MCLTHQFRLVQVEIRPFWNKRILIRLITAMWIQIRLKKYGCSVLKMYSNLFLNVPNDLFYIFFFLMLKQKSKYRLCSLVNFVQIGGCRIRIRPIKKLGFVTKPCTMLGQNIQDTPYLFVVVRVEVEIVEDDGVGGSQVDSQST